MCFRLVLSSLDIKSSDIALKIGRGADSIRVETLKLTRKLLWKFVQYSL